MSIAVGKLASFRGHLLLVAIGMWGGQGLWVEDLPDLGTTPDFNLSSEFHTRVCPKRFRNFSLLGSNVCI